MESTILVMDKVKLIAYEVMTFKQKLLGYKKCLITQIQK